MTWVSATITLGSYTFNVDDPDKKLPPYIQTFLSAYKFFFKFFAKILKSSNNLIV
jgi:hypothetical protein